MRSFYLKCAAFIIILTATVGVLNRAYFPNDYRMDNDYAYAIIDKHAFAGKAKSPKILLCGGSSMAFGVNSIEIQTSVKKPVINLALMASVGLDFMLNEAAHTARANDIVILSPEYLLAVDGEYSTKRKIAQVFIPAATYFNKSYAQRLNDYFKEDLRENLNNTLNHLLSIKMPISLLSVYSRSSFNQNGDIVTNFIPLPALNFANTPAIPYTYYPGIKRLNEFKKFADKHHIEVYFIYAPYPQSLYNNNSKTFELISQDFNNDLKIKILNRPIDAVLPDSLFYNTEYHLRPAGRELRTQEIIKLLKLNNIH
jgi:hypothetical protein